MNNSKINSPLESNSSQIRQKQAASSARNDQQSPLYPPQQPASQQQEQINTIQRNYLVRPSSTQTQFFRQLPQTLLQIDSGSSTNKLCLSQLEILLHRLYQDSVLSPSDLNNYLLKHLSNWKQQTTQYASICQMMECAFNIIGWQNANVTVQAKTLFVLINCNENKNRTLKNEIKNLISHLSITYRLSLTELDIFLICFAVHPRYYSDLIDRLRKISTKIDFEIVFQVLKEYILPINILETASLLDYLSRCTLPRSHFETVLPIYSPSIDQFSSDLTDNQQLSFGFSKNKRKFDQVGQESILPKKA